MKKIVKRLKTSKYSKRITFFNVSFYIIKVFLIVSILFSFLKILNWFKENKINQNILETINSSVNIENEEYTTVDFSDNNKNAFTAEKYNIDFNKLKSSNKDTVAWLKLNNTNIEYPIVKAQNNEYYLNHSFDRSVNSAGWIFIDYKNKLDGTDKNIILYGHNRKDGSMFANLENVLEKNWYMNIDNQNIIFITPYDQYNCKIFSIYQVNNEDYYITTHFEDDNAFSSFIKDMKLRSIYDFQTDVSTNDTLLTLSTCGINNKYRIVIHAKVSKNL